MRADLTGDRFGGTVEDSPKLHLSQRILWVSHWTWVACPQLKV
jgi:hypothetical protein